MVKKEMDDYKQKGTVWLREYKNEIAITVLIIVILILSPMLSPFFLSGSNLLNLLRQTAYTAIAAIGMYFVILIGGIDLSIGATIQIIGMVSITMLINGVPVWLTILTVLGIGVAVGLVNGLFVTYGRLQPFVVTLVTKQITLNVLEESAREDGTCYEESDGLMRQKTPTELLQVLLQREAAAQIMTKEAEINALQSQINPHFLYNTLETIRGQALCCGATSIADATKALAEIFRYNISQKGAMISLKEELANIDAYMRIQSIRFNDRFTLHSDVAEDTLYIQIPKLLVQPVIENALKHGLEVKRGKGNIWISAFRTANRLEITVEDDGVGISPTILKRLNEKLAQGQAERLGSSTTSNIGLANINERIKLIYGTDYGVTVLSAEQQGTRVILSLGILS